jgi:hypothetical protein
MGKPKLCLWKCEACGGWFNLRAVPDREQRFRVDFGIECSCPDPNIQQRFTSQELRAMNAIDRVVQECENVLADSRELKPEVWAITG